MRPVRAIGKALLVTGNPLATKSDARVLPSEPLQALFMDPAHGVRAFQCAKAFLNLNPRVEATIAGAYPSSLLLPDEQVQDVMRRTSTDKGRLVLPPMPDDVARNVKQRMAALRFDYPDTVHLDKSKTTSQLHASGEDLTNAMSSLSFARGSRKLAFYVPYGHGHAPLRLVYSPVPTPMFGSVPVWVSHVIAAVELLLQPADASDAKGLPEVSICPVFPCENYGLGRDFPQI